MCLQLQSGVTPGPAGYEPECWYRRPRQCSNNFARYETGDQPQLGTRRIQVLRQIEQNINSYCMIFITGNNGRETVS